MSNPIFVYVACADVKEARKIAGHCVEARIAACGDIFPTVESTYWWEGQVRHRDEVTLILKTTDVQYPELEKTVTKMHSYEVPCMVSIPISNGLEPFINWIKTETKPLD